MILTVNSKLDPALQTFLNRRSVLGSGAYGYEIFIMYRVYILEQTLFCFTL